MKTTFSRWFWPPVIGLLLGGCASTVEITTPAPSSGSAETRIPLRVALVLGEELTNYVAQHTLLGKPLVQYAEAVTHQTFAAVESFPSAEDAANQADLILVPKPVHFAQSFEEQYSATADINLLLMVEWIAKDRANSRVLWLETIEGRASRPFSDGPFSFKSPMRNERMRWQEMFDALNRNTVAALRASREIRELATAGTSAPPRPPKTNGGLPSPTPHLGNQPSTSPTSASRPLPSSGIEGPAAPATVQTAGTDPGRRPRWPQIVLEVVDEDNAQFFAQLMEIEKQMGWINAGDFRGIHIGIRSATAPRMQSVLAKYGPADRQTVEVREEQGEKVSYVRYAFDGSLFLDVKQGEDRIDWVAARADWIAAGLRKVASDELVRIGAPIRSLQPAPDPIQSPFSPEMRPSASPDNWREIETKLCTLLKLPDLPATLDTARRMPGAVGFEFAPKSETPSIAEVTTACGEAHRVYCGQNGATTLVYGRVGLVTRDNQRIDQISVVYSLADWR